MLSGFYTATSGMLMQQRYLNVLSDNMANAKTPGYRTKRVVSSTFDYELMVRQDGLSKEYLNTLPEDVRKAYFARTSIGGGSPIRIVDEVPSEWEQGAIEESERPYDMSIIGEGFFTVHGKVPLDEDGEPTELPTEYLTRNGNFNIDDEGYLILPKVGRVCGEEGYIKVGGSNFKVCKDGNVIDNNGKDAGKLKVINPAFDNLDYMDNGCFVINSKRSVDENNIPIVYEPMEDIKIEQFSLEKTNVDVSREMMLAMEVQRSFQACSKALIVVDQMNQKAANQIAAL